MITLVNESIDGTSIIRTYNKVSYFKEEFYQLEDKNFISSLVELGAKCWLQIRLNIISITFIAISYVYCILNREDSNTVSIGLLISYLVELQWNLNRVTKESCSVNSNIVSFDRCMKMCKIPQEAAQSLPLPPDRNGLPWISNGRIRFADFSARYRPDTELVLNKISFEVKPEQKIGVVGRTGAGKSTL